MKLSGRRILYDSRNHGWSYGWTFYQMLAEALAAENDVVYLDSPVSAARLRARDFALLRGARTESLHGLRVLRTATIPAQRTPALQQLASRMAAASTARWAQRTDFTPELIWCYMPSSLGLLDYFQDATSVYWTGDEVVMPREAQLLERVDVVLCASEPTYERRRKTQGERAHFVPVACDFERYRAATGSGFGELAELERPLYGYAGFVNERVDASLLVELGKRISNGTVVVIGPIHDEQRAVLEAAERVAVCGPQTIARVPQLIDALDVALIPYCDNEFNRNSNPVKFYEYLALGKPVVSTDIPTLRAFSGVASIGARDSFVERVISWRDAVPGSSEERVAVAADHSFGALLARLRALPV